VLQRSSLVSDYTFAKDQLFARLNLSSDELSVYGELHGVLAEKIPLPDWVVYLRADVDALMERIALRDRTYERAMSRQYMADVVQAYDAFFGSYSESPVLTIDTNDLNFARDAEHRAYVLERIKSAFGTGTHQRPLLETPAQERGRAVIEGRRRRLSDLQYWRRAADQDTGATIDPYQDFIALQAVLGGVAGELGKVWSAQEVLRSKVGNYEEARDRALQQRETGLKGRLADSLAFLLRLANDLGVDLEEVYLARIENKMLAEGDKE